MKIKPNEIKLPSLVKRGRIDLTEARAAAGLDAPMTAQERAVYEESFATTIQNLISRDVVLKNHAEALRAALKNIQKARADLHKENEDEGSPAPEVTEPEPPKPKEPRDTGAQWTGTRLKRSAVELPLDDGLTKGDVPPATGGSA